MVKGLGSLSLLIRGIVIFLSKENLKIYLPLPLLNVIPVVGAYMPNKTSIKSVGDNGSSFVQNRFPAKNNEKFCNYYFFV